MFCKEYNVLFQFKKKIWYFLDQFLIVNRVYITISLAKLEKKIEKSPKMLILRSFQLIMSPLWCCGECMPNGNFRGCALGNSTFFLTPITLSIFVRMEKFLLYVNNAITVYILEFYLIKIGPFGNWIKFKANTMTSLLCVLLLFLML